jgi:hypothetical protein
MHSIHSCTMPAEHNEPLARHRYAGIRQNQRRTNPGIVRFIRAGFHGNN